MWLGVCLSVSGCVWPGVCGLWVYMIGCMCGWVYVARCVCPGVCGRVYVAGCMWSLGVYDWVSVVGYRDAQVGWVEVREDTSASAVTEPRRALFLVIYAPRRGLLEVQRTLPISNSTSNSERQCLWWRRGTTTARVHPVQLMNV